MIEPSNGKAKMTMIQNILAAVESSGRLKYVQKLQSGQ